MATTISEAKENYQCVFYAIGRMMVSITMPEPWPLPNVGKLP